VKFGRDSVVAGGLRAGALVGGNGTERPFEFWLFLDD
jgi:hypothetical protein